MSVFGDNVVTAVVRYVCVDVCVTYYVDVYISVVVGCSREYACATHLVV